MESYEGDRPATDVEQDLGEPGSSVESLDADRASIAGGLFGVGAIRPTEGDATDVADDLGEPGDVRPD